MKLTREEVLENALKKISRWHDEFPPTGQTWQDGTAMSYSAAYSSNGERDYMRQVALDALAAKTDSVHLAKPLAESVPDELRDALQLILPLAKAYAAQNRVGANAEYIEQAERALRYGMQPPNTTGQPNEQNAVQTEQPSLTDERAAFEEDFAGKGVVTAFLKHDPDRLDCYWYLETQNMWEGWQARALLSQRQDIQPLAAQGNAADPVTMQPELLQALRDGIPLTEPVYIHKALLAQREARTVLSGGTGPLACVHLVNIGLTGWVHTKKTADAFTEGYNLALKQYRSALLTLPVAQVRGMPTQPDQPSLSDAQIDAAIEAYDAAWNPANRGRDNKAEAILAAHAVLVSAQRQDSDKDAERYRKAIAYEDNAGLLYCAVMNHCPDKAAIDAEFDAEAIDVGAIANGAPT